MKNLHILRSIGGGCVTMPIDSLEHIAACLDNQKFMGQWNADAVANPESAKETDRKNQACIDDCSRQLREACRLSSS